MTSGEVLPIELCFGSFSQGLKGTTWYTTCNLFSPIASQNSREGEEHTVMCSLWSFCLTWKWRQAIVELSRFTNQGQIWPSLCQCGGRGNGVKTVSTEPQPFAQFWAQSENWKQNASGMLATGHAGSSLGGWFRGVLCSRWERRKSRIISLFPLGYGQKQ